MQKQIEFKYFIIYYGMMRLIEFIIYPLSLRMSFLCSLSDRTMSAIIEMDGRPRATFVWIHWDLFPPNQDNVNHLQKEISAPGWKQKL